MSSILSLYQVYYLNINVAICTKCCLVIIPEPPSGRPLIFFQTLTRSRKIAKYRKFPTCRDSPGKLTV